MADFPRCHFEIVSYSPGRLVIKDVGLLVPSVTNCAEEVVAQLMREGILCVPMRLEYIDSDGNQDEILFDADGFKGFKILRDTSVLPAVL